MVTTKCKELTWKTKNQNQKELNRSFASSELGNFVRSWIRKFEETDQYNFSEKLIYLWVTINAWASMVAPQIEMNHQDSYLIHALSVDPTLNKRFNSLYSKNSNFQNQVDKLLDHAPVFQVLC